MNDSNLKPNYYVIFYTDKPSLVGSSWTQNPSTALDGQTVTFSCATKDGFPKQVIVWLLNGASATGTTTEDTTLTELGYNLTSHLSFQATTAAHSQKSLTCRVSHSKLNLPITVTKVLNIHCEFMFLGLRSVVLLFTCNSI